MPRPVTQLTIAQPCSQNWDAMTPSGPGRHCAACQKVVVDFTQKTDAEILALLARTGTAPCGRFGQDQLNRPLLPATTASYSKHGRAWLAAMLTAWSFWPAEAAALPIAPTAHHAPAKKPVPRHRTRTLAIKHVQGTVCDSATGTPLVGVAVFLRGENRMARTDSAGCFRLQLAARRPRGGRALVLHFAGYASTKLRLPATTKATTTLQLTLAAETRPTEVEVIGQSRAEQRTIIMGMMPLPGSYMMRPPEPLPRRPRSFWRWLTRPLRRS